MQNHSLTSLWSLSADDRVLRLSSSRDGKRIAVGTSDACLVVDAKTGKKSAKIDSVRGPVTALAFVTNSQLLIGAKGVLRLWDVEAGKVLTTLNLAAKTEEQKDTSEAEDTGEAVLLAVQPHGERFAATSENGRKVFIVDQNLLVQRELELNSKSGSLSELSWLSNTALLATSRECIQGWQCNHASNQPCLVLGLSIGLVSARASPDHSTLAAGSRDGVVYLWSVQERDYPQSEDALVVELRSTLKSYSDEVHLLRWDPSGRYLATMDGSVTTVWDVPELFQQPVQSTICSGHENNSRILCAAFQDEGPILATGDTDGKVLFYNSATFLPGQVNQLCASAQNIPFGDGVTCVAWLPGGQLVAGTEGGRVIGWQLQPAAAENEVASPPSDEASVAESATGKPQTAAVAVDCGANGFTKKATQPKPVQRPARPSPAEPPVANHAARPARGGRALGRDSSSGSLSMERNSSMPTSKSATDNLRNEISTPAESAAAQVSERARSLSLQDGSGQGLGRRATSLDRQQLSPSLMQHIQRVQQKPAATTRNREPSGWGTGSPAAPASPHVPYGGGPAGVMTPFSPQQVAGGMPASYLMYQNQAAALAHQQSLMPQYGFPPGIAPMGMLPPGAAHQQGMLQGKQLPGMPPGMLYYPVGPQAMPHHQQWQMVHPWHAHYYMHAGQSVPEHINIVSAGRSISAPESSTWATRPPPAIEPQNAAGANAASGSADQTDLLGTSAISLPPTVGTEWRNLRGSAPRQDDSSQPAGTLETPHSGTRPRASSSSTGGNRSSGEHRDLSQGREEGESRETLEARRSHSWAVATAGLNPAAIENHEGDIRPEAGDLTPVLTVYVGNLPPTVDEVALMVPFSCFGSIANIQVIRDKNSLQSRGFAFVSYSEPTCAATAIANMNGRVLYGSFRGRALKVGRSNRTA